jgi:anti-anti-sigma factor
LQIDSEVAGPVVVVRVVGELDSSTSSMLRAALEVAAATTRRIHLDMAGITFIDSSGAGTLMTAQRALRNDFCELVVQQPSPVASRVLELTGATAQISVVGPPSGHPLLAT